jgi:hypothetical protein
MNLNTRHGPLSIAGRRYPWGIGMHACAGMTFDIGGRYRVFAADVGLDTVSGSQGSVRFIVKGDGRERFRSEVVRGTDGRALSIRVPVDGVKKLTLEVDDGGDLDLGDLANWGSARVLMDAPAAPAATVAAPDGVR